MRAIRWPKLSRMLNALPKTVSIVEVGPRDGLQNTSRPLSTAEKIAFVNDLAAVGLRRIEVSSFVNPKWIPNLADAAEVFAGIARHSETTYSALVPNLKGYRRAREAGAGEVAVFLSVSETHNLKNLNSTVADQLITVKEVAAAARADGLPVRGYLSTVFGCPYEGEVDPGRVADLTQQLVDVGCYEISLGDTIGVANPRQVSRLITDLGRLADLKTLALHFHDTRGLALVNAMAGLEAGITVFDSSAGGLGGCPYAPGASGNVATEDLVYLFHSLGIDTGIDLDRLCLVARKVGRSLGQDPESRYNRARGQIHDYQGG